MPIFQFFHKNKPSIKSTYLGFVLFSGRQIQRFAVGEILWSIYTEIIPGEEPSRVVTVLGRGLRGTLWRLLQFYCHVIFSSAGGLDLQTFLCRSDPQIRLQDTAEFSCKLKNSFGLAVQKCCRTGDNILSFSFRYRNSGVDDSLLISVLIRCQKICGTW